MSLSIVVLNQSWFVDELRSRGHKVVTLGWNDTSADVLIPMPGLPIQDVLSNQLDFKPDVLLYLDDSRPLGLLGFESLDMPTIYLSVDAHHHATWQRYFSATFDHVLVAQRNYVDQFERFAPRLEWFPLWIPREIPSETERTIDISFRGNVDKNLHPKRAAFFERLNALVEVDAKRGPFIDIYPKSRIVINQSVGDDLNFRVFEAMAAGAMLLTQSDSGGVHELFEEGVDLVTYAPDNAEDAAEKVKYYLENEDQRASIAAKGKKKVYELHSESARTTKLENLMTSLVESSRLEKSRGYFGNAGALLNAAVICREGSPVLADMFAKKASECLEEGLERGEPVDPDFELVAIGCKCLLEESGYPKSAFRFVEKICELATQSELLAIVMIECLLTREKREEATQLAQSRFTNVEGVLASAPELLERIRNSMFLRQQEKG